MRNGRTNMKILTIAIPSYNSEAYLANCLESLLVGGERVELIVIDDGSKDRTGEIADEYAAKYPSIVRVIHQPNGGHGEGVNQGMLNATGVYYKVVDSDDLLQKENYLKLLDLMEELEKKEEKPDLIIADFIYEKNKDGKEENYVMGYENYLEANKVITWDNMKAMHFHHMFLMHALYYRTEALRKSGTILPKHCFYVDDIFAYRPLPHCKKIYYFPHTVYRYQIGRETQSVNEANFIKNYKMLFIVMMEVFKSYSIDEIKKMPAGLRKYMHHCISVLNLTALFSICVGNSSKEEYQERKKVFKDYYAQLKNFDKKMYRMVRYRSYHALIAWLPYCIQRKIIVFGYHVAVKHAKVG